MREIKFRAWRRHYSLNFREPMIYKGLYVNQETGRCFYHDHYQLGSVCSFSDNEEPILMQYTGLKDKNGKEIYEGDLLRAEGKAYLKGEVTFNKGCFDFLGKWLGCMHPVEVIGNIYENPELLTVEKGG